MPAMRFWHIADESYVEGDCLLCWDSLTEMGEAPKWKWPDAPVGFEGHLVSLFPDTERGRKEADLFWLENPTFVLLKVEIPDYHEDKILKTEEGYPAIFKEIPREWITLVRRGYRPKLLS